MKYTFNDIYKNARLFNELWNANKLIADAWRKHGNEVMTKIYDDIAEKYSCKAIFWTSIKYTCLEWTNFDYAEIDSNELDLITKDNWHKVLKHNVEYHFDGYLPHYKEGIKKVDSNL